MTNRRREIAEASGSSLFFALTVKPLDQLLGSDWPSLEEITEQRMNAEQKGHEQQNARHAMAVRAHQEPATAKVLMNRQVCRGSPGRSFVRDATYGATGS
ncbi:MULTISPECIES: hypothetical protein [unclassified Streptomyces]|uniref:hypothetical protein n=1 Tax=unclassified Streptomyces TaxID=2593676 RepID=UPI0028C407EB|nr:MULTISPECIES: hypothetical protein [unclassified Streptomyces]WNO70488.1 hypothetical protein RPQ07_02105 [Streptomyces sp. AM8-1-1]